MVNKVVYRSLKKNGKLFGAIFILFTLATMIISLGDLSYNNLERSNAEFRQNSNREDFRVYYSNELADDVEKSIDDIEKKYNIETEKAYYNREEKEGKYTLNVYPYDENQAMDKLTLSQGEYPTEADEVVLTDAFFTKNNLKLGDKIELNNQEYKIVGTVFAPEYTMALDLQSQGTSLGPDSEAFGAAYVNEDDFKVADDATYYYRMQFVDDISETEAKTIRDEIAEDYTSEIPQLDSNGIPQIDNNGNLITKELNQFVVVPASLNVALTGVDSEIKSNQAMFNILGAIIMGLALALTVVLMQTIFKSQRREIGILKAEGIRNSELKKSYLGYLLLSLIIAQIIGLGLATLVSPTLEQTFLDYYALPVIRGFAQVYGPVVSKLIGVLIVVMIGVYFIAINPQLKQRVLMLVKNIDSDKPPKINISRITRKMSFARKYQINILIRNFTKTLLLAFGVMVSSFLLLQGSLILNGISNITEVFENGTINYDYLATYETYKPERTADTALIVGTNVDNPDETSVELFGFDPSTEMMDLKTVNNKEVDSSSYDGAVISDSLAQDLELEIGDELKVINPYQQDEEITLPVNEIVSDPMNKRAYVDIDYLQNELDLKDNFVNAEMGQDKSKDEILKNDKNASYLKVDDLSEQLSDQMGIVYTMVGIIAGIASIIAVVTLITITIIIINNNRKTISVMKVLGYTNKEIKKIITAPYRIILIVVYFGSIPLIQQLINSLIQAAFADADFQLNVQIDLKFALLGFVIIYLVYEFSMYFAYRVIKRIKLAESLKVDE